MAAGRMDKEIAAELSITLATVKTHVRLLYGNLGVKRRPDAVSRAYELGLIGDTPTARLRMILDEMAPTRFEAPNRSRFAELYDRVEMILNGVPQT